MLIVSVELPDIVNQQTPEKYVPEKPAENNTSSNSQQAIRSNTVIITISTEYHQQLILNPKLELLTV